jgi:hypothetical protein
LSEITKDFIISRMENALVGITGEGIIIPNPTIS